MHRQIGSPATAWQTVQTSTTSYERATPTNERELYTLPETIALNSQLDQSLREAVEVKSNPYLGPVALSNERTSRMLQAAHLAIADQSPFNLRNTDPKISIRDLNLKLNSGSAPRVVAEAVSSTLAVPIPPRTTSDASGNLVPRPEDIKKLSADSVSKPSVPSLKLASAAAATDFSYPREQSQRETQSYRGISHNYAESTQRDIQAYVPTVPGNIFPQRQDAVAFDAAPGASSPNPSGSVEADLSFDHSHIHAAWGLSEEPSLSKGTLNNLLPGVGALKKASLNFESGMPASNSTQAASTDTNISKAIKAGDALHTGRMGNAAGRLKDNSRLQNSASLPLFDINSARTKFQADNVTFSKSISPNGERMQVQTAADFSSITEIWTPSSGGSYLYRSVYRDELNRVRYEESVCEQGLKTVVQTGYCDREEKKSPFVAYKMMIKPDGTRELLS